MKNDCAERSLFVCETVAKLFLYGAVTHVLSYVSLLSEKGKFEMCVLLRYYAE